MGIPHNFQIEQEMELILSRPGVFSMFSTEWKGKRVPAIMKYCKALKRKDVMEVISDHGAEASSE